MFQAQRRDINQPPTDSTANRRRSRPLPKTLRLVVATAAAVAVFAVIILWPAGRPDWVAGWFYIGIVTVFTRQCRLPRASQSRVD